LTFSGDDLQWYSELKKTSHTFKGIKMSETPLVHHLIDIGRKAVEQTLHHDSEAKFVIEITTTRENGIVVATKLVSNLDVDISIGLLASANVAILSEALDIQAKLAIKDTMK